MDPATIGVAAVFLAIIGYGLLRPGGSDLAREAAIPASYSEARTMTDGEEAAAELPAGTPAIPTTAAPMTTTAAAEVTTTTAETDIPAEPPENTTAVAMMAAGTQDRGPRSSTLKRRRRPPTSSLMPRLWQTKILPWKSAASVAEQIVALTGLQPLHDPLALDGPTFAAFVPRNDAAQLVDLLRSIGASAQIPVFMDVRPPDAAAEATTRLFAQGRSTYAVSPSYTAGSSRLDIHHLDHGEIGRGNGRHGTSPAGRAAPTYWWSSTYIVEPKPLVICAYG